MSRQLVQPDTTVTDGAGWCLRFTQSVWGAPAKYESAWYAWTATQFKHTEPLPEDIAVVVWFSHYGTYGNPPRYDNWGHVVTYVPGQGFLSSPQSGIGQKWLATIQDVERAFNSTYVGWSEDINGLRVASYYPEPPSMTGEEDVTFVVIMRATGQAYLWNTRTGAWQDIPAADQLEVLQRGFKTWTFNDWAQFANIKTWYEGTIVG